MSASFGWLPELPLVAFRVHHPAELAVLGVVRLLEHVATLRAQRLKQRRQVRHAVVDHERRLARRKLIAFRGADRPDRRALDGIARVIGPRERGATPWLHIDAEMLPVPGRQGSRIPGLEEYSADTGDSLHLLLPGFQCGRR